MLFHLDRHSGEQNFLGLPLWFGKASLERQKADCSNIAYVNFNCKKAMECIQELEKGIEEFQPSLIVLRNI